MKTTPVTFPPGLLRLVTSPSLTGSLPAVKTIGILVVAALARRAKSVRDDHSHRQTNQIGDQPRQPIKLVFGPAEFDHNAFTGRRSQLPSGLDVAPSRSWH